ncbi:MAG: TIGR03067 domain-containing protein [Gemmataceae bacterium]|nr:TIGR03067 domain-containing protein [Gemmataceae bacterium]
MYSTLLLGLAVAVGAPGAKDPPKKEAAIVGEWLTISLSAGGMDLPQPKDKELRFTFAADGKLTVLDDKMTEVSTYTVDAKKSPAEIDMTPVADSKDLPIMEIFKIDGDTLTLCVVEGKKDPRPTKFESPKDSRTMLLTLKRDKMSAVPK